MTNTTTGRNYDSTGSANKAFELDIPHYYYNICGSGDDDDQRICLINEEGKWLVYYCEDGDRMEVSEYADEAQACEDCLCRLSN